MYKPDFFEFLVKKCGIDPTLPVLVGFSAGPDSLYLLHRMKDLGFNLIAGHVDHSLRPASIAEAEHAAGICLQWGIPFVSTRVPVSDYARENKLSVEEAAREVRYRFLFAEAKKSGAQAVLVAHHADDQVETVLMHFLRGSGTSGLAGMRLVLKPNPWSSTIPLVRPLLRTWRREIVEYCQHHELTPVLDESNTDVAYFRNRIRTELIPQLETYNPNLKDRLLKTAEITSMDEVYLQEVTKMDWQSTVTLQNKDLILFNRTSLLGIHPALRRRLFRKAIGALRSSLRDIDFDSIEKAVDFVEHPTRSNSLELLSGLEIFQVFRAGIAIADKHADLEAIWHQLIKAQDTISIPGELALGGRWVLSADLTQEVGPIIDKWRCSLDHEQVVGDLKVRVFKPGDRFAPFGDQDRTLKLGYFFTNEGLPGQLREKWPLVVDDEKIVWIPGLRISQKVRITEKTRKVILLQLSKK